MYDSGQGVISYAAKMGIVTLLMTESVDLATANRQRGPGSGCYSPASNGGWLLLAKRRFLAEFTETCDSLVVLAGSTLGVTFPEIPCHKQDSRHAACKLTD